MGYESDSDTNCSWALGTVIEGLIKGLEELEIRRRQEISQNIEKSSWDLKRLAVT